MAGACVERAVGVVVLDHPRLEEGEQGDLRTPEESLMLEVDSAVAAAVVV